MRQFRDEVYRLELIKESGVHLLRQDLRSMRTWLLAAGSLVVGIIGFIVFRKVMRGGFRLDFRVRPI